MPRGVPGAVLGPAEAQARARVLMTRQPLADSICVHGDSDDAALKARAVRAALGPRRR